MISLDLDIRVSMLFNIRYTSISCITALSVEELNVVGFSVVAGRFHDEDVIVDMLFFLQANFFSSLHHRERQTNM